MRDKEIMQEIQDWSDCEAFKRFAEKLTLTAGNMSRLHIDRVVLPNLIFLASPGSGVTMHLRLLSELLVELKLLPFIGEEDYFEWSMSGDPSGMDNLLRRVRKAGGFYGQFRGVVGLDLGSLVRSVSPEALSGDARRPVPNLDRLMEYVEAQQGRILFCFILPLDAPKEAVRFLLSCFASKTPAEIIELPFPKNTAKDYIADQLYLRGFTVTKEAMERLRGAVEALRETPLFEGYQTLQNLADEIVWRKMSGGEPRKAVITASDVAFIRGSGGYLERFSGGGDVIHRRRIGFGERGDADV